MIDGGGHVEYSYDGVSFRMSVRTAEALEQALDGFLSSDAADPDIEDQPPTPSGEFFCGCSTCSSRETLVIASAIIIRAVSEGGAERLPDPQAATTS